MSTGTGSGLGGDAGGAAPRRALRPPAGPGSRRVRQVLLRALAVQVALVAAAGLFGAGTLLAVRHGLDRVSRTLAPASTAEAQAREAMIDMETGLRGYLLTGDRDFLAPYTAGRASYTEAHAQLAALPLDHRLAALVAEAHQAALRWQQEFAEPAVAGDGSTDAGTQARAKAQFDAFRAASDGVQRAVDGERARARDRLQVLLGAGLAAVVLAVVLALLAALRSAGRVERSVVGPLESVRAQLARLRDGVPGHPLPARGPDELQDLTDSYNALARESERRRAAREEERRLREASQRVVRRVRRHLELPALARQSVQALGEELDLAAVRLDLLPAPGEHGPAEAGPHPGLVTRWPEGDSEDAQEQEQPEPAPTTLPTPEELADALDRGEPLDPPGAGPLLRLPVGAAGRPLGLLTLRRGNDRGPWPLPEVLTLQLVAQELGRAVEHARLYRAQQDIAERLTELDRARTDFVATVGHELRNPLFAVSGYAQLLATTALDEQQREWLAVMGRGLDQASALLDDLRDYSRGAPEGPVHDHDLDLAGVVDDAVAAVRAQAVTHRLELVRHPAAGPVPVRGDRGQLERAVANLLSNAVKYTPAGGRVEVRCLQDASGCHVVVEDTGIGIPAADRSQLFTRFYRAGNARLLGSPGTGLGLVVVKAVAERHGGDVSLTSQEGVGTRVVLSLPRAGRSLAAGE
ncbi:MAG TPA: ATP-binding protein [Motilibacteraceae bacterium]|nr:ATP-binding protein [Motilibacteraceae bacterium]